MALSNGAIIVIVIVACLASVTLGAALFKQYNPADALGGQRFSREQEMYMRSVRLKNMGFNYRESRTAMPMSRDVESAASMFPLFRLLALYEMDERIGGLTWCFISDCGRFITVLGDRTMRCILTRRVAF
ncbi:hypothetical protein BJY01DRAFT_229438 [Aspergillus pseudoustus]|uniref:Uncharacterized protein n=1 Tax=Aspergillus pseudoustus TaxID=1810923 RepID=A0ABR4IGS5_9EURO